MLSQGKCSNRVETNKQKEKTMLDRVEYTLVGMSKISFSRAIQSVKNTGENHDDFEKRTFRERVHSLTDGTVILPPQAVKKCLQDCAKYLSESVQGKGKSTYTKHFMAGTLETDEIILCDANGKALKVDELPYERLYVPSDGKQGGTKRVWRQFCYAPEGWTAKGMLYLLDPILIDKPEKVNEYLEHAGKFIGLCRWRPRNGGMYGRFKVNKFDAIKAAKAA